jgi:hypothetical protein
MNKLKVLVIMVIWFVGRGHSLYAYTEIPIQNGGNLTGTIVFKSPPPTSQAVKVIVNPEYCGETMNAETFLFNDQNRGLKNVVIRIEGIEKGKKGEDPVIFLENMNCRFVPHVQAGMVGNSYHIQNLDPILHSNHLRQNGQTILNVAMPPDGRSIKKPMQESGMIKATCDAHSFMTGTIFVADNPYYAVTDRDGKFTITQIPPGKYRLSIWHEALPAQERLVIIQPNKTVNLSLDMSSD